MSHGVGPGWPVTEFTPVTGLPLTSFAALDSITDEPGAQPG